MKQAPVLPTYPLRTRWHIRLIPDPSIYSFSTSFRVFPIFFRSPSIVFLQVSLGLPWLLVLSACVHLSAVFMMDWFPFLKTWHSHLNCPCFITVIMFFCPVLAYIGLYLLFSWASRFYIFSLGIWCGNLTAFDCLFVLASNTLRHTQDW